MKIINHALKIVVLLAAGCIPSLHVNAMDDSGRLSSSLAQPPTAMPGAANSADKKEIEKLNKIIHNQHLSMLNKDRTIRKQKEWLAKANQTIEQQKAALEKKKSKIQEQKVTIKMLEDKLANVAKK
ncbi:MAG: hypothetical protein OEZ39_16700 [Gammaproteobacteria bacterium]|nr:hypothetical protein [Gammaproteobacteria bacterium]MDH5653500.1 hypothetical protein [Gammaproteobacteria bacterium]